MHPADQIIARLADTLLTRNIDLFRSEAGAQAGVITTDDLPYLRSLLHRPPPEPAGLQAGLGQWLAACQYVIFELVYQMGPAALDFLRGIAFGVYDWTQATALDVLCRLWVDGALPDDILAEINSRLGDMRYETHAYLGTALLERAAADPRYLATIERLDNEAFRDVLRELREPEEGG